MAMAIFTTIPPIFLHLLTTLPILLLSHLLHLPSLSLHSLYSYIHPDATPSATPRAIINPNPTSKKQRLNTTPFDASAAQVYRLLLTHSHLSTRLHFLSFYFTLLLPVSLSLPSFLLNYFRPSESLFPFLSISLSMAFLLITLLRLFLEKSESKFFFFSLLPILIAPMISLVITPLTPLNTSPLLASTISAIITPLLFNPCLRFSSGFWLGTDQLHLDFQILSCTWIGFLLLYSSTLVSFACPLLFITSLLPPFMIKTIEPYRVLVLASGALLQIFSLRALVQMYLNEGVVCWYQQLHASRVTDLTYARAKIFLHNHRFCIVATQLVAPPILVLLLLAIYSLNINLFDSLDFIKDTTLFVAWWVMFAWSFINLSILACYRFGLLLIS